MELPEIVSEEEWQRAHGELVAREKAHTRATDALAAERRRQPMVELRTDYEFEGPDGRLGLLDLFEGRSQLILYHAWFPPGGTNCGGCTMFADQVPELAHLRARDTAFALVSAASQREIEARKEHMGWDFPWYTTVGSEFQERLGTTEHFKLHVLLRDGDRVFLTYETTSRGVESLGSVWTFLDLTPLGRQETWEDTPPGRPQTTPYDWWDDKDRYEFATPRGERGR